jgi:hypothetical protein
MSLQLKASSLQGGEEVSLVGFRHFRQQLIDWLEREYAIEKSRKKLRGLLGLQM